MAKRSQTVDDGTNVTEPWQTIIVTTMVCGGYIAVLLQAWLHAVSASPMTRECHIAGMAGSVCPLGTAATAFLEAFGAAAPFIVVVPTLVASYVWLMRRNERPLFLRGVILIQATWVVLGVLNLIELVASGEWTWNLPPSLVVVGLAAFNAGCAVGLWLLHRWARLATMLAQFPALLSVLGMGFAFPAEPGALYPLFSIAIHVLIIMYLNKAATRALFCGSLIAPAGAHRTPRPE